MKPSRRSPHGGNCKRKEVLLDTMRLQQRGIRVWFDWGRDDNIQEDRLSEEGEDAADDGKYRRGAAVEEDAGEVARGVGEELEHGGDLPLVRCEGDRPFLRSNTQTLSTTKP